MANRASCEHSNCCRYPSTQKELKFFGIGTISFDDELTTRGTHRMRCPSPKFLRTQSSSGLFASPRKSRSATRVSGAMSNSVHTDSPYASNGSIRDKNFNYSSLSSLARILNLSQSNMSISKLYTAEHIIDEDSEFEQTNHHNDESIETRSTISEHCISGSQDAINTNHRKLNSMARLRLNRFRSRSISCDSWENVKSSAKRYAQAHTYLLLLFL